MLPKPRYTGGGPDSRKDSSFAREIGPVDGMQTADHRRALAQIRGHGRQLGIGGEQRVIA